VNKAVWQKELQGFVKTSVLINEPMKKHTTWNIGGPADFMVFPSSEEELIGILQFLHSEDSIPFVMGNGSNILVGDKGIRGVVIRLAGAFSKRTWRGNEVDAQAGALLPSLALEAAERSLTGMEFAAGIPGSFGGAIRMNAGAYGNTIGEYVTKVGLTEYSGTKRELTVDELTFEYRKSNLFSADGIVTSVTLKFLEGDREQSMAKIKELLQLRIRKQPLEFPSCGSVFRNPVNDHAGRLIEMANLRGTQIGGAMVSRKHGNFIINLGGAKAKDVLNLIEAVQRRVEDSYGVHLETEVKLVGEFER